MTTFVIPICGKAFAKSAHRVPREPPRSARVPACTERSYGPICHQRIARPQSCVGFCIAESDADAHGRYGNGNRCRVTRSSCDLVATILALPLRIRVKRHSTILCAQLPLKMIVAACFQSALARLVPDRDTIVCLQSATSSGYSALYRTAHIANRRCGACLSRLSPSVPLGSYYPWE